MSASLRSTGAVLALCLAHVSPAQAQSEGFAIGRFDPAERGSDWFVADSLDMRGHGRLILGATGDWAFKPLVAYEPDGDERAAVIRHQVFAHAGASLLLWDRLRLGVNVPILAFQRGKSARIGEETYEASEGAALGDVRAALDVRLVGKYASPFSLALGAAVYIPTGSQEAFASDGEVRVLPRVLAAGDLGPIAYAAKLGVLYRRNESGFQGATTGTELVGAAALGVRAAKGRLVIGPEVFASTVVTDSDALFARRETPFELLFSAHYRPIEDLRLGAGFGPGLTRGLGAPEWRGVFSIEWVNEPAKPEPPPPPEAPPPDRDKDKILDSVDACPDEPGIASDDPKKHGCPERDRDGDGILDEVDACPDEPGIASEDPTKHGCPRPDTDEDGVFDDEDACVDNPGPRSEDPAINGCPDTDQDGIFDPRDACPTVPGPADPDPKKNGCPAARVEKGQIKILDRVEFEYNSAKLTRASDSILTAVLNVLMENPTIKKIDVQGHTDNRGSDAYNLKLSNKRAAAVVKWLIDHGIDAGRLTSHGYGMNRPIDSNESDEGRQNNRRVEFHILEQGDKPITE